MSLSAAVIDALVASGVTVEQLASAIKADLAESEGAVSLKRAKDAERQRRHRLSRDVTVTNGDIVTSAPLSPPPLSSPHTPQQTPPPHTPVDIIHPREARPIWPCPDGIGRQHWLDWLKVRKAKKCPTTDTAREGALRKIGELADDDWPPGRIVQALAELGWAGVHDPRTAETGMNDGRNRTNTVARFGRDTPQVGRTMAAGAAFVARGR